MRKHILGIALLSATLVGTAYAQPSTNGPSGTGPEGTTKSVTGSGTNPQGAAAATGNPTKAKTAKKSSKKHHAM
jgi:hypothetical protein